MKSTLPALKTKAQKVNRMTAHLFDLKMCAFHHSVAWQLSDKGIISIISKFSMDHVASVNTNKLSEAKVPGALSFSHQFNHVHMSDTLGVAYYA